MRLERGSIGAVVTIACALAAGVSCAARGGDPGGSPGGDAPPATGDLARGSDGAGNGPASTAGAPGIETASGAGTPASAGPASRVPSSGSEASASGIDVSGLGSGAGGSAGPGGTGAPARPEYAPDATLENTGLDCAVPALAEPAQLPRIEKLPDPFQKLDGTRLTRTSEWRCRRREILEQAEKYIYGEKPPKPERVTGTVSADRVSVQIEHQGKSIQFSAELVLPPGPGPFPAIINLGARNGAGGMTLGESFILEQGVAIIFYDHYALGQEGQPEASRGLPNPGLFYDIYGGDHSAGLLMAWAWGASRIMDVLQDAGGGIIDPERVGVTGCSRNGKGAFTVGVFDERIALTIPQETSTGGLPAYRIVDVTSGAERTNYNFYGLNWLSNDFAPFVENAPQLPVDSHEMVAMLAPRGLLVLDNPHIPQFAAAAAHTAVLAGAEVYRALGVLGNVSYISDVQNAQHCAQGKPEYTQPLIDSISRFLKHQGEAPGTFRAGASGAGDLAQWRDWDTPTLQTDTAN